MANSYVTKLSAEQIEKLRLLLEHGNWELKDFPYAHWQAKRDKTNVTAYTSGKLVVQGKGTADFVSFVLEPEILGTVSFGYEDVLEAENFTPHGGIDESGKGDFFGPLVIAAVYADRDDVQPLRQAGVKDSKAIKSDKMIRDTAENIRKIAGHRFAVVKIGPEAYNRMYAKIGNLNRLLAWGHARAIENLLERVPDCNRLLSDKFGHEHLIKRALMEKGRNALLEQKTKAESDVAVAAASILARDVFIREMDKLGELAGCKLPRGAGARVKKIAAEIARSKGREIFPSLVKMHFKTTAEVLDNI